MYDVECYDSFYECLHSALFLYRTDEKVILVETMNVEACKHLKGMSKGVEYNETHSTHFNQCAYCSDGRKGLRSKRSPLFFMKRTFLNTASLILVCMTVGICGCQTLTQPLSLKLTGRVRSIETVQKRIEVGKTIFVQGTVGNRIPLVNGQVYELKDTTGSIWIVSPDSTIKTGEELMVQGKLSYQATPEYGVGSGERYLWEVGQFKQLP